MGLFEGVGETYEKHRHGYSRRLREHLVEIGALTPQSRVIDLGAGTGQLTRLVAPVAGEVVAVEPEADMLAVGHRATGQMANVRWVLGSDADLRQHFDSDGVDLVVIGNAFHHMNHERLLRDLDALVGPRGFVCVASSSVPVWLHDSDWSLALRAALEGELGPLGNTGVPDDDAAVDALVDSAFSDVSPWAFEEAGSRSCASVLGEVISSASGGLPPAALDRLRAAIEPFADDDQLAEVVRTTALIARRPTLP